MTKYATLALSALTLGLAVQCARSEVTTREESVENRKRMVLENDAVRMVVVPDPGGTVIEFVNKKTNTNFVAGGDNVLKGRLGYGWKDYYWLEALDQMGKGIYALPYKGEFRSGPGYKSIYVACETEGRRFEREMRLADKGAELTTLITLTNISDKPLRLQPRWHTYSTLDDIYAENSAIIAPGPDGEARKCFIGSGWDHQFITTDGYWLAANYKSGQGMWMTFRKEQSAMQITWTDYNHSRRAPSRGMYIAEPYPQPVLAKPGESVKYESTFYPFTADDPSDAIPLGMLSDPAEKARARQFLSLIRSNLGVVGPYTMTPGKPPAGIDKGPGENRFDFSHRRRDRFALRTWGIADAMMVAPGVQDQTVRCRYYTHLFAGVDKPLKVSFRLSAVDAAGVATQLRRQDHAVDPAQGGEVDVQDNVAINNLPDGQYRFVLDVFVEGETAPVHTYVENRRLVGQARPIYEKTMADKAAAPLAERPFVAALAKLDLPKSGKGNVTVPVGVEDGSGIARKGWPVRCGVPFAQGLLPRDASFELLSPEGKAVAVQAAPMATWLDGSLKWALVDFAADVPADGHVFYTLKNKAAPSGATADLLGQKDLAAAVGAGGVLFGCIGPNDLWWSDGDGQKYFFRLKGEGAGVVIEENGPNRGVVKATGWYFNDKDRPVCMGELRMERYRGQTFSRLYHTVMFAGDPWKEKLGSYGIRFTMPKGGFDSAAVELDGQELSGKQLALFQRSPDVAESSADAKPSKGKRSTGAVVLKGKTPASIYHRNFWQMAPKKIDVDATASAVTFSYWPAESGAMSFLPREDGWIPSSSSAEAIAVGMSRTHEFIIDTAPTASVVDCEKVFSEPVIAVVPPKYLTATKAMMHLSPYDPARYARLERVISDTVDFYAAQRDLFGWYGEWEYGGIPNFWRPQEYRWFEFGRYAWILNEEDIVDGPWLCFLRSGDRKYLTFAESNTRHLMEVATIRWNPVWPTYVGFSRRHHECIWLSGGDSGHSMLDPFLDCYYATGYRPARDAAERMAGGMAQITSGSWRYISNPTAGLARMYLDTQNPRYKEHADRIWNTLCYPEQNTWWVMDHGERMAMWYSQLNPQCKELWKAWTLNPEKKDRFTGPDVLTALYLETGDLKYARAAAKAVPAKRPETITQYVMAGLRSWCYAGESVAAEQTAGAAK